MANPQSSKMYLGQRRPRYKCSATRGRIVWRPVRPELPTRSINLQPSNMTVPPSVPPAPRSRVRHDIILLSLNFNQISETPLNLSVCYTQNNGELYKYINKAASGVNGCSRAASTVINLLCYSSANAFSCKLLLPSRYWLRSGSGLYRFRRGVSRIYN